MITLVVVDQIIKFYVDTYLKPIGSVPVISKILQFSYYENDGAMMGLMSGKTLTMTILAVLCLGIIAFVIFLTIKFIAMMKNISEKAMKKMRITEENKQRISLLIMFSLLVFAILLIAIALAAVAVWLLVKFEVIGSVDETTRPTVLVSLMCVISAIMGSRFKRLCFAT